MDTCTAVCGSAADGQTSLVNTGKASKLHTAAVEQTRDDLVTRGGGTQADKLLPSSAAGLHDFAVSQSSESSSGGVRPAGSVRRVVTRAAV